MSDEEIKPTTIFPDFSSTEGEGNHEPAFLDPVRVETMGYVEDDDSKPDFADWDNNVEPGPMPNQHNLKPRHRAIARHHAMGKTNNQICELLGYSTSRVSILLKNPVIQREVDRYRNQLYEVDVARATKEMAPMALDVIETTLKDENVKMADRISTAKWLIEKTTGKPKQEISIENNSLENLMETVRQMKEAGEVIDSVQTAQKAKGEILEHESDGPRDVTNTGSRFDRKIAELLNE